MWCGGPGRAKYLSGLNPAASLVNIQLDFAYGLFSCPVCLQETMSKRKRSGKEEADDPTSSHELATGFGALMNIAGYVDVDNQMEVEEPRRLFHRHLTVRPLDGFIAFGHLTLHTPTFNGCLITLCCGTASLVNTTQTHHKRNICFTSMKTVDTQRDTHNLSF